MWVELLKYRTPAKVCIIFAVVLACLPFMLRGAVAEEEQLLIFVQPGISETNNLFEQRMLPEIRELAGKMGVAVHVLDAGQGAPAEVAITPLMVYQNHRGRSVYQGRTTTVDRVRNFIRTSRFVPQGKAPNVREQIPIWQQGRSRVWAPLKVSGVTGTEPPGYRRDAFIEESLNSIGKGFKHFNIKQRAELSRADRGFYMDFYPWRGKDGTLFLSLALYSQFHCKEPVFEKKKKPLIGPWEDRDRLFRQAAVIMENEVRKQLVDPLGGDGFDPMADPVPRITWQKMGYPLPAAPLRKDAAAMIKKEIPRYWVLDRAGPDASPMIQFRFPAPLDQYSGEIKEAAGELSLPAKLQFDGATGYIEVDTRSSVTMGEPVLDEAIRGSLMLSSRKHPTARFTISKTESEGEPVAYGRLILAGVSGEFVLKGKSVPLALPMEVEPVIGEDGNPRLLLRGSFRIDLKTFNIEGADGPAPANHTLVFDVNLAFRARNNQFPPFTWLF